MPCDLHSTSNTHRFSLVQPQLMVNCYYAPPLPRLSALLNSICWRRRREFPWTGDLPVLTLLHYTLQVIIVCSNLFMSLSTTFNTRGLTWHASAVKGASSTIRSILCQPEGLWHCKKLQRLQWKHKCSSVLANCGSGGKAAFCLRHLHKVCSVSIWVSSPICVLLSTKFFIRLRLKQWNWDCPEYQRKDSFDHNSSSYETPYENSGYTLYLHVDFTIDQRAFFRQHLTFK